MFNVLRLNIECQRSVVYLIFVVMLTMVHHTTSNGIEPQIVSTQNEVIAYVNHTGKLSCIIENLHRQHVTWSRVQLENETQKLLQLLFVNSHKYTPFNRYHLTHSMENDHRQSWHLEIRHVQADDQGFYSCVVSSRQQISKLFQLKVLESPRNPSLALRSTSDIQRRSKEQNVASSHSISNVFLFVLILFVLDY